MDNCFVADTHALFFHLVDPGKLGVGAKTIFDQSDRGEATLIIPWIVIAELFWIAKKRLSNMDFSVEFQRLRDHPQVTFVGLDSEQVLNFLKLDKVSEMHDRIIVGVAYGLGIPLLTRDQNIRDSDYVTTIWH